MSTKSLKKLILLVWSLLIIFPTFVYAVQITVPSAPSGGYLLYSLPLGNYTTLTPGANGECLSLTAGTPDWVTCATGGGSSGGTWSTTTSTVSGRLINYPNNDTDIVTVGANSTTSAEFWFDPNTLRVFLSGRVGIGTTSPYATLSVDGRGVFNQDVRANYFTATSTATASTFPYASSTSITASTVFATALRDSSNENSILPTARTLVDASGSDILDWTSGLGVPQLVDGCATVSGTFLTSTGFECNDASNLSGQVTVAHGGTGQASFGQGWIYSSGGTTALNSSTSPTVRYIVATSTTVASIFPYASTTVITSSSNAYFATDGKGTFNVGSAVAPQLSAFGTGYYQGLISTSSNDVMGMNLWNTSSGSQAASGIFLNGDLTPQNGIGALATYYAGLVHANSQWNGVPLGFGALPANGLVLYNTDGNLILGSATTTGEVDFYTGAGSFAGGTPDMKLDNAGRLTVTYASTTALTVSGASGLSLGTINGPLQANNGRVTATTSIGFLYGGTGLTSASDDTTLVSSGTAWVASALPNCTDTGGNHLNYTTATNAFSCGTSSSGGSGGSMWATTSPTGGTANTAIYPNSAGLVAIGTTTPWYNSLFTLATSTGKLLTLFDTVNTPWNFSIQAGNLVVATSSLTTGATSTPAALQLNATGVPSLLVGTSTATTNIIIDAYQDVATSSVRIDTNSTTKGGCLVLKDFDGVGYTYVTASNGVLTASTISCL